MNYYKRLFTAGLIAPMILSSVVPSIGTVYAADREEHIVLNHDGDLKYGSNIL
jgi:hypothetical protein